MSYLIPLNKFTRKQIVRKTGFKAQNQTVICVGNIAERTKLEREILEHRPVIVYGSGKMTAVLEIVDKHNLECEIDYYEQLFADDPFLDKTTVYITRLPDRPALLLSQYIAKRTSIVILAEKSIGKPCMTVNLLPPSKRDIDEYKILKGSPMIRYPQISKKSETDEQLIAKGLRYGFDEKTIPDSAEAWILKNFPDPEVFDICAKSLLIKDKFWKARLLSQIRYERPINLKRPFRLTFK